MARRRSPFWWWIHAIVASIAGDGAPGLLREPQLVQRIVVQPGREELTDQRGRRRRIGRAAAGGAASARRPARSPPVPAVAFRPGRREPPARRAGRSTSSGSRCGPGACAPGTASRSPSLLARAGGPVQPGRTIVGARETRGRASRRRARSRRSCRSCRPTSRTSTRRARRAARWESGRTARGTSAPPGRPGW